MKKLADYSLKLGHRESVVASVLQVARESCSQVDSVPFILSPFNPVYPGLPPFLFTYYHLIYF
jgi:hypothetical protein